MSSGDAVGLVRDRQAGINLEEGGGEGILGEPRILDDYVDRLDEEFRERMVV